VLYFANPNSPAARTAMAAGLLGLIDTPHQRNTTAAELLHEHGVAWCADNGAFSDRWQADHWWTWLAGVARYAPTCRFAVAPDVVGDAAATEVAAGPWLEPIRELGYPVAYVAQNGLRSLPWDDFDVLFLGGDDAFKLGPEARAWTRRAVDRGKPVHMGRVNSQKRFLYAHAIGCSSVDGTALTFHPTDRLAEVLSWGRALDQTALFEV
jgi:hypothetical protein